MPFGGFGPDNLLELTAHEDAALISLRIALLTMSAYCLVGQPPSSSADAARCGRCGPCSCSCWTRSRSGS